MKDIFSSPRTWADEIPDSTMGFVIGVVFGEIFGWQWMLAVGVLVICLTYWRSELK